VGQVPPSVVSDTDNVANAPSAGRPLGLITCSALVVGNVIGSGFFLSPSALAPYGIAALVGWVLMGGVAICLALLFARLAQLLPGAGGPYAFTRRAFGPFAGFIVAWAYWISMWVSQPAIALTFVGYLGTFFPLLAENKIVSTVTALAAMWAIAALNIRGMGSAGVFENVAVGIKLIPFFAIGTVGLFWIHPANFVPALPNNISFPSALASSLPLIMFAFLGIESSTVPADNIVDPVRTIPRATILGTLICVFIFLFCTITVMGVVPRSVLVKSSAPFADAAGTMWGYWARTVVAITVVLSSLAALNGWTLLIGQVPRAAAKDGLFPDVFVKLNKNGVPAWGIMISIGLSSLILLMQASGVGTLVNLYKNLINLSTTAEMIPYVFCALSEGLLIAALAHVKPKIRRIFTPIALISFVFSVLTIYGAGPHAGLWTLILVLLGLPFYVAIVNRMPSKIEGD
jgi:APA family basic amino acid/polyamine antiporter